MYFIELEADNRTVIKKFKTAITGGNKEEIAKSFTEAQQSISATAQKGVIHKKTGARYVSRLASLVNKSN